MPAYESMPAISIEYPRESIPAMPVVRAQTPVPVVSPKRSAIVIIGVALAVIAIGVALLLLV